MFLVMALMLLLCCVTYCNYTDAFGDDSLYKFSPLLNMTVQVFQAGL